MTLGFSFIGGENGVYRCFKKKNMKVREFQNWGVYFRKRWEDHFANHLSDKEKEDIFFYGDKYACGYLWHIFSYEKKKCLVEMEAESAFHNEVKYSINTVMMYC